MMSPPNYSAVISTLGQVGLAARGGFAPKDSDGVPTLSDGQPAAFVVLAGNVGPAMWQTFSQSPEFSDQHAAALDRWSHRVLNDVAIQFGGVGVCETIFPFEGPPHYPFQRWAQRADTVFPSPTGPLIHPEYGLWHAYRGALVFSAPVVSPPKVVTASPCDTCDDQPCLTACPVDAFTVTDYNVMACVTQLASFAGIDCNQAGCLARRACPVGQDYLYAAEQAAFHTAAFVKSTLLSTPEDPS